MPPAADWDALASDDNSTSNGTSNNDAFYRRTTLYDLSWRFPAGDLSDYILAAAPNGGPLALTRNESKPVLLAGPGSASAVDENGQSSTGLTAKQRRIWVYSSAGTLLQSITWDSAGSTKIIKLGWTANESLVVLAKDGSYRLYPLSAASKPDGSAITSTPAKPTYSQHSLAHDVQDASVVDARIHESGMVVILTTHQFLEVRGWPEQDALGEAAVSTAFIASSGGTSGASSSNKQQQAILNNASGQDRYGKGRVERMAETQLERSPSAWCILTPDQSTSRQTEILLSANEALLGVDQLEVQDQHFSRGPFSHIIPSPSGRFIAFVTSTSPTSPSPVKVYVVSANYSETLSEYELSASDLVDGPPKSALWCGNNSVVLAWDASLLMIGPFGQTLRYDYLDPIHLVGELDGIRIISLDKCEFLHKVAASTVAVFSPGSVHPAAILYEAYEEFSARNAHAHESISNIRVDLVEAVDTCTDAAAREYDVSWQRKLLKAASFGKTFLDLYNPADFVATSQILRVLNAVRNYEIGIPITYEQYRSRAPTALVQRLTLRHRHLLALRVAAYLKLSTAPVLRHWAQVKVRQSRNEQEEAIQTCNMIVARFKEESEKGILGASEVSCAEVAKTAWEEGKLVLATRLLDHEPRASKQVHLLLNMREDNLALVKATRSGDSDLILSVLLALRRQHSVGNFFRFLDGKDEATAILTNYGKKYDKELIRDFWFQDDRRTESATFDLEEAAAIGKSGKSDAGGTGSKDGDAPLSAEQFGEKMEKVRRAQKTFSEDKDRGFEAKMCEDELRLLAAQQSLQAESGTSFNVPIVGLSLNETVRQCLIHDMAKKAEKLRVDFRIPDKRWWYLKLKALTEIRDWDQLESFAKSKKSPIGYEPFVEHLMSTGNQRQAVKFIARCETRNRPDLYAKAGEWVKAGEECRDRGERGKLNDLIQRAPNTTIAAQLQSILEDTRSF